jgi:hypothetical protein
MGGEEQLSWESGFSGFYERGYHIISVYYAKNSEAPNGLIYTRYIRYTNDD